MSEIRDFAPRAESEVRDERQYLESRIEEIERGLGTVAAGQDAPISPSRRLDALDRARELASELHRQIRVRPLVEAVEARLAWLDRVESRRADPNAEPRTDLDMVALDRRLLGDLLAGWQSKRK